MGRTRSVMKLKISSVGSVQSKLALRVLDVAVKGHIRHVDQLGHATHQASAIWCLRAIVGAPVRANAAQAAAGRASAVCMQRSGDARGVPTATRAWVEHQAGGRVVRAPPLRGGISSSVHALSSSGADGTRTSVVLRRWTCRAPRSRGCAGPRVTGARPLEPTPVPAPLLLGVSDGAATDESRPDESSPGQDRPLAADPSNRVGRMATGPPQVHSLPFDFPAYQPMPRRVPEVDPPWWTTPPSGGGRRGAAVAGTRPRPVLHPRRLPALQPALVPVGTDRPSTGSARGQLARPRRRPLPP